MHTPGNDTLLGIDMVTTTYNTTCNMWESRAACALTLLFVGMLLLKLAVVPLAQQLFRDIQFFTMEPPTYAQKVLTRQPWPQSAYKSLRMLSYGFVTFVSRYRHTHD